jgi:PhzF family phenazine biosynthesis protein
VRIRLYQIDAFTSRVFAGNPAAVCPLESWLPDATMQSIAAENNLAMTAFFVGGDGRYELRWFTPEIELDLCGHGTLASALVVFEHVEPALGTVRFETKGGTLAVQRDGDLLALDFPARPGEPCAVPAGLVEALGAAPVEMLKSRDHMAVLGSEEEVRSLEPDMEGLKRTECFAVIATAPGRTADFVSRFFAPAAGIAEDPATGSAHCTLTPYWSRRLGKPRLRAQQVSPRGGELWCEDRGDRVRIAGRAVPYLEGTITL